MSVTADTAYEMKKTVALGYDEAVEKVRGALTDQGFGILTEIDIKQKMKEKLGVDFKRYIILGACKRAFTPASCGMRGWRLSV
jgi:uncharacterized protein (DUF302 family)